MLKTITDEASLRAAINEAKQAGQKVGLVPTMGALHAGHMQLVKEAKKHCDYVVASIFVNPMQFGAGEDLDKYPRTIEADTQKLEEEGAELLFLPEVETIYPKGYSTTISVSGVSEGLCGASRAGHFDGVATVVAKLFNLVQPDVAFFGEKDYQQLQVIKRMAIDLNMPVTIQAVATVRESDGLALSSRNQYLSEQERAAAPAMRQAMQNAAKRIVAGEAVSDAIEAAKQAVIEAGYRQWDYLELRHADTLEPLDHYESPARLLAAAWLGTTRLIDNIPVE